MAESGSSVKRTWRAAGTPIVVIGVFGATLGITYPLLSLLLEERGTSSSIIGLNGAMTPLGMVLGAPLVPRLIRAVRPWLTMVLATALVSVILAVLAATPALSAWFVLRFMLGLCAVTMFILSETWIGEIATSQLRGQLLTAYTSVLALGFAIGPTVLAASGDNFTIALTIAIAAPLVALVPLVRVRQTVPPMAGNGPIPVRQLTTLLSTLVVAVLAVSVFDSVTLQLLPSFGVRHGNTLAYAALSLTVLLIGQVVFQYPLGWLADRVGARVALIVSLSAGILGALLLPMIVNNPTGYFPAIAAWGGLAFAGYPLVLTILGESFEQTDLLMANTAFAIVWGLGGILGPPYSGAAMDWVGPNGLPWSLATLWLLALTAIVATACLARQRGTRSPDGKAPKAFSS
ncbi:MFS transporter [Nocardia concava]|uniref:MFS transporter n=1 Tax=Nocardia concava TaxID=257281 RepID=UPI000A079A77|nr:MFS transporter [Nocardia concava]